MLKARLISAAIMVPLVVYGVLFLSTPVFTSILAAILLAALWEWSHLIPVERTVLRVIYTAAMAVLMWLLWQAGLARSIQPLLLVAFLWWLGALFWLSRPQICAAASLLNVNLKLLAGAESLHYATMRDTILGRSGLGDVADGYVASCGAQVRRWIAFGRAVSGLLPVWRVACAVGSRGPLS